MLDIQRRSQYELELDIVCRARRVESDTHAPLSLSFAPSLIPEVVLERSIDRARAYGCSERSA